MLYITITILFWSKFLCENNEITRNQKLHPHQHPLKNHECYIQRLLYYFDPNFSPKIKNSSVKLYFHEQITRNHERCPHQHPSNTLQKIRNATQRLLYYFDPSFSRKIKKTSSEIISSHVDHSQLEILFIRFTLHTLKNHKCYIQRSNT